MKRCLTYIILLFASLILGACHVFDDYMYGPEGEQKVKVSFVLALGSSDGSPVTRAESWDPDDPTDDGDDLGYDPKVLGDEYDNMIAANTLQVVFYTAATNAYYSRVNIESCTPIDGSVNEYLFTGSMFVEKEDMENSFKMMVIANVDQKITPFTKLEDLTFRAESQEYIPMWGVKTLTLDELSADNDDKQVIYVLRSMAKIEVEVSDALNDQGYTLSGLKLNNLNTDGYVLPAGALTQDKTEDLKLYDAFNPYASAQDAYSVTSENPGSKSLVMYVPEYDNDSSPATINVSLLHNDNGVISGISPKQAIEFRNYNGGQATGESYDILRNHNYRFVITGISVEGGLKYYLVRIEDLELGGRYGFEF